jgi:urocanate hydratase
MAEMAIHRFAGDCARGMSLVAIHIGGGVGTGKAVDCGFGLVLDGSRRVDEIIRSSMSWDVISGVARRAWARNEHAIETIEEFNKKRDDGHITLPFIADKGYLEKLQNSGAELKCRQNRGEQVTRRFF